MVTLMQQLSRMRVRLLTCFGLPILALIGGCSSEGSISGKVTYKDKPLTGGIVLFTSSSGSSTANINEDGSYSIERMPTGDVKIAVDTQSARGPAAAATKAPTMSKMGMSGPMPPMKGSKSGPPVAMQPPKREDMPAAMATTPLYNSAPKGPPAAAIPENYADPTTSGLTYTVIKGPQVHNIDLK